MEQHKIEKRFRFTVARLAALPSPSTGRAWYYDEDTPGLAIMVTNKGAKSFYFYRKVKGRPERIKIDRADAISVDAARKIARQYIGEIAKGENPAAAKRKAKGEQTLGGVLEHWQTFYAEQRLRSWKHDKHKFDKHLSHLKQRRLSSISRAELQTLHTKLGKDSGPVLANRIIGIVKKLYNYASDEDSIGYQGINPAARIKPFPEQSRDRFLQVDELPRFWKALQKEEQLFQDFFMIALLTGVRRGNVEAMRWDELHLESASWRVPRTKNNEPLLVHLPAKVVEILRRRHEENGSSVWVFPSWGRTGHIVEPKASWQRILKRAGLKNLRMHDLRRTLASWQALQGVSLPVIGKSLGHRSLQSTEIYARLTMEPVIQSVNRATEAIIDAATAKPKRRAKHGK